MRPDRGNKLRYRTAGSVLGLGLVLLGGWSPLTAQDSIVVEFPGAVPVATLDDANAVCVLPWSGYLNDLAIGTAVGEVRIVRYAAASGIFQTVDSIRLTGEITDMATVVGPGGTIGEILVVTRNPDAFHALRIQRAAPYVTLTAALALEEDPGAVAVLGPDAAAVALSGVDTIVWVERQEAGWALAGASACGDRPIDLAACDLDADGVTELVVANEGALSNSLMTFRREAGGYVLADDTVLPEAPHALAAGDRDGDGRAELAVVGAGSLVVRIYAAAAGGLVAIESVATTVPVNAVTLAPLPGGGWGLYPASTSRGIVEFYLHEAGGWSRRDGYYPGCRPFDLAAADLNGDGYPDLVSAGGSAKIATVMFGSLDLTYWGFPALALPTRPGGMSLGDFTGDGLSDVVVMSEETGTLAHYHGRSTGGFEIVGEIQDLFPLPGPIAAIDADGAGPPELAVFDRAGAGIHLTDHVAGEGFVSATMTPLVVNAQRMASADVDGDGHQDLVVLAVSVPEVRVLFGAGDRTFPEVASFGFENRAVDLAAIDLDGDGRLDLVGVDGYNRIWTAANSGGRAFVAGSWLNAGAGARALATGDLDGDLDEDVVVVNVSDETLTFFENTGSGGLDRRIGNLALEERPEGILVEDVNLDGRQDVLVNQRFAGTIAVVYGLANWNFAPPSSFAGGVDVAFFATEDFNTDLAPDILTLDASLYLGLTMLNLERGQVAVARGALEATCAENRLHARIRPEHPGPWRLDLGGEGAWRLLATDAGAVAGGLEVEAGTWYWSGDVPAGPDAVLRLTVGAGDAATELRVAPGPCGEAGPDVVGAAGLAWRTEPWPNPFNPLVRARIDLVRPALVTARIYDLRGRVVATILEGHRDAGTHDLRWDGTRGGRPAEAGTYLLRVGAEQTVLTRKLMLLK